MNLLTQAAGAGMGIGVLIFYVVIIVGIMYFMAIRPQKKEQKRVAAMLAEMEIGDSVVTNSGFYGVLIDITEDDVIVEFGSNKNCRIPMRKSAIAEVEKQGME
ncbi:preprotein translocase subunit YajC [Lachnospiraceae bacterium 46-15]